MNKIQYEYNITILIEVLTNPNRFKSSISSGLINAPLGTLRRSANLQ